MVALKSLPALSVPIGLATSLLGAVLDRIADEGLMQHWILMYVNKWVSKTLCTREIILYFYRYETIVAVYYN